MSGHTPGPWFYAESEVGTPFVDSESVGDLSAVALPLDEQKANAHLIAAAPDLLAACDELVRDCSECNGRGLKYGPVPGKHGSYAPDQPCVRCGEARAAIAKARGEP